MTTFQDREILYSTVVSFKKIDKKKKNEKIRMK